MKKSKIDLKDLVAERERLKTMTEDRLKWALEEAGFRKKDIAQALKVADARISAGLESLADFGLACGVRWELRAIPEEKFRPQKRKPANERLIETFRKAVRRGSLTHPGHPRSCMCGCQS